MPSTVRPPLPFPLSRSRRRARTDSHARLFHITLASALFTSGTSYAQHFATIYHPIGTEYDLQSKHPESTETIKNVDGFHGALEELRSTIFPELELIDSRVVGPLKEFQGVMKTIRKMITKRDHKVRRTLTVARRTRASGLSGSMFLLRIARRLRPVQQLVDQAARQEGEIAQRREEPVQGSCACPYCQADADGEARLHALVSSSSNKTSKSPRTSMTTSTPP